MKNKTICLMVLACLPLRLHGGPAFEKAINRGAESEGNYIGRLKTMGLWFVSKMNHVKAVSKEGFGAPSNPLPYLIENTLKSQYSWGADAIKEFEYSLPNLPLIAASESKEAANTQNDIYSALRVHYILLHDKLRALGAKKVGDEWLIMGDPERMKF